MSPELDELMKQAMSLPPEDREILANSLFESLDHPADEGVEAAWQEEVARRMDDIESGKVKTVPSEQVRRKGQQILRGK
jgi:putative addiction module component (TIGR02574 family)